MLNSLLRNAVTPLSLHRISRLSLAVSLILSAPYGQVLAASFVQSEIDGVFSGSSEPEDYVVGLASDSGDVNGGNLSITKNGKIIRSAVNQKIYVAGAYSGGGSVFNSTLTHNGTASAYHISFSGGYSNFSNANNNKTVINGSIINSEIVEIFGGKVEAADGSADSNSVIINSAKLSVGQDLIIHGGTVSSNGSANNNTLTIKNTVIAGGIDSEINGGYVAKDGVANNNTVIVEGGYIGTFVIGGAIGQNGSANGNTVILNGATVTKNVIGGLGGNIGYGTANNNTVILEGGVFSQSVYGGMAIDEAINNKIYVYGTTDLSSASLFGNYGGDITGNTLYLGPVSKNTAWSPNTSTINMVSNFEKIAVKGTKWGQTITINSLDNSLSTSGQTTAIDVGNVSFIIDDASILEQGASYDVLKVNTFNGADLALASTSSTFTAGTTLQGTGTVSLRDTDSNGENETVTYTINKDDVSAQPQTHDVVMVSSAATTAINQIADTSEMALMNLLTSGNAGLQLF